MCSSDLAFYDRICTGAADSIAFDIINRLVLRTSSLRSHSLLRKQRQTQSIKEIDRLMKAIQKRDVAAAREAALEHVRNSARSALSAMSQAPQTPAAVGGKQSLSATTASPRRRPRR